MIWEISHNREQRKTEIEKNFSPFSHTCAFETAVDKFFSFINLNPSLSSVLKVYSSSELSKRSGIFHFLSGGTNGFFRVRVGELIFIPRSARS